MLRKIVSFDHAIHCALTNFQLAPLERICQDFFNHADLKTWMTDWQLENHRVSPMQCRAILSRSLNLKTEVEQLEKALSLILSSYFSITTNNEWLGTFLIPIKNRLNEIITKATKN